MSEKLPSNQPQPIVKIGHYTLGQTLGVGTFGKVKSMYKHCLYNGKRKKDYTMCFSHVIAFVCSWGTCTDETQSCCEDFESPKNQKSRCCRQDS